MSDQESRAEARSVSLYPSEWDAVDRAAQLRGLVTARGPNTSQMLRQIIREYFRGSDAGAAAPESNTSETS